jgi:hypothetical protein
MRRARQPVRRAWRASLLKDLGRNFPVDVLKIDRSFVRDITSSEDVAAMVAAIIELACGPRMRVIVEGVETEAQFDYLRRRGLADFERRKRDGVPKKAPPSAILAALRTGASGTSRGRP